MQTCHGYSNQHSAECRTWSKKGTFAQLLSCRGREGTNYTRVGTWGGEVPLTHPAKWSCTAGVTFGMSIVSGALCSTLAYFRTKILPHNILNVLNATTIGSLLTDFQAHQPSSFSLDRFSFQKPGWCLLKPPFRQNPKFYFLGRASLMRLIGWVRWVLGNTLDRGNI